MEKSAIVELLDEAWVMTTMFEKNKEQQNIQRAYYDGLVKMLERLGYAWSRNENGKHEILNF